MGDKINKNKIFTDNAISSGWEKLSSQNYQKDFSQDNENWENIEKPEQISQTAQQIAIPALLFASTLKSTGQASQKKQLTVLSKDFVNTHWKPLFTSADCHLTNQHGYRAAAFINKTTKEILIASYGTNPLNTADLQDDAGLLFGIAPKMKQLKTMVDEVIKAAIKQDYCNNEQDLKEQYTFSTTGHSLGAIVSDLTALEIASREYKFDKSTTFDSPGSNSIVLNATNSNLFSKPIVLDSKASQETNATVFSAEKHMYVYNAEPNLINCSGTQLGNVHVVYHGNQNGDKNIPINAKKIWDHVQALPNEAVKTLKGHGLKNFTGVFSTDSKNKCVPLPVNPQNWQTSTASVKINAFNKKERNIDHVNPQEEREWINFTTKNAASFPQKVESNQVKVSKADSQPVLTATAVLMASENATQAAVPTVDKGTKVDLAINPLDQKQESVITIKIQSDLINARENNSHKEDIKSAQKLESQSNIEQALEFGGYLVNGLLSGVKECTKSLVACSPYIASAAQSLATQAFKFGKYLINQVSTGAEVCAKFFDESHTTDDIKLAGQIMPKTSAELSIDDKDAPSSPTDVCGEWEFCGDTAEDFSADLMV